MPKPQFTGPNMKDQAYVDAAKDHGMPVVDGKQAVAYARQHKADDPLNTGVNWYTLEDGTEIIRDDQGRDVEWPD